MAGTRATERPWCSRGESRGSCPHPPTSPSTPPLPLDPAEDPLHSFFPKASCTVSPLQAPGQRLWRRWKGPHGVSSLRLWPTSGPHSHSPFWAQSSGSSLSPHLRTLLPGPQGCDILSPQQVSPPLQVPPPPPLQVLPLWLPASFNPTKESARVSPESSHQLPLPGTVPREGSSLLSLPSLLKRNPPLPRTQTYSGTTTEFPRLQIQGNMDRCGLAWSPF